VHEAADVEALGEDEPTVPRDAEEHGGDEDDRHHDADHPEELPPGDGDLAQRVTDWIAGMTDRYCLRAFRDLAVPRAFAS
jgi:dGTP triphosphohydrolase